MEKFTKIDLIFCILCLSFLLLLTLLKMGCCLSKPEQDIVPVSKPNVDSRSHKKKTMLKYIEANNRIIVDAIVQTNAFTQNIHEKLLQTQITRLDILLRKDFKNMEMTDIAVCTIEIKTLVEEIVNLMSYVEEHSATNNLFGSTRV